MEPTVPSLVISSNTPPPQTFPARGNSKFDPQSLPNPRFQQRLSFVNPDSQRFHAKKDLNTSHRTPPPTPVAPRYAGVPRLTGKARTEVKAKRVSFKPDVAERGLRSPFYNPEKLEPFLTQCYDCLSKIGMGSFSEVFMARSKEDGKFYAVKRLNQFASQPDRRRKLDEVKKCQMFSPHENLVRFYDAWEEKNRLYIMTELCEMSMRDLTEKIHSISEPVIWNYLYDLLRALKHLHDNNLVHLDVKPANIFLSKEGTCKLGDFGLLIDLSLLGDSISFEDVEEGDGCYLAPEVLTSNIITKAADIFSLGITMLEIATDLELPAHGDEWKELREGVFPPEFVSKLSSELLHVIQWMMHPEYQKRPTVDQLLSLPQLSSVPLRRQHSLTVEDEPQRQLMGAALRASTPLGVPQPPNTPFSLSGAQVPFSTCESAKVSFDDTSSVPVAEALNFEFGRGEVETPEERACTPTGTPRMLGGDSSPNSLANSSWVPHPSSLNASQNDDDAVMATDEDNSFNTTNASSSSRINSAAFDQTRNRPENKLSPFIVPAWALDRSDRAGLEAPNTAPPAIEVRSVTPDLVASSPLMSRHNESSSSRSQHSGVVRRPSPVALCEIFEQLPATESTTPISLTTTTTVNEGKRS